MLQNLKSIFKTNVLNNRNKKGNIYNSEIYDYKTKIKKIYSSNHSFEKSKILNNNNKFLNNNININNFEQKIKIKKKIIDGKSILSLKDRNNIISHEVIDRNKSKENNHNIQAQKILHPQKIKNSKSQTQKDIKYINTEKDNNVNNTKIKKKLILNNDLLNKIHKNKFSDLYSFSSSPSDRKINLDFLTINSNFQNKKKQKILKTENENEIQKGKDLNIKKKYISRQNSTQNDQRKIWLIKNQDKTGLSTGRIKLDKKSNKMTINKNEINMPLNINMVFNKTFIEKDYNKQKNNINIDNFKIRNTMKELKIKDNFNCLTGK